MKKLVVLLATLFAVGCSCETINEGNIGFIAKNGKVDSQHGPGLYIEGPMEEVILFSTRLETFGIKADSASKDLQKVSVEVTIPYTVDPNQAIAFYRAIGTHEMFGKKMLGPAASEATKASAAGYTAEELVTKRVEVKQHLTDNLTKSVHEGLKSKGVETAVTLGTISITDFDFSDEFDKSIEQKVKSEQEAQKAVNEKQKKITEAEASTAAAKLQADAEAYTITQKSIAKSEAIKREAQALTSSPELVKLRAIEKWSGNLPVYSGGGATPFIQLKDVQ